MIGPYPVGDFRRIYFDYFSRLSRHRGKISFRGKQLNCLLYLVNHPIASAYKIKPSSKTSQSEYKWAKEAVKQLRTRGLIELTAIGKSKDYSLTDEGIYYLIANTKLPCTKLFQDLIKNYSNSNIFRYLVYPYIELETFCSPKMDQNILAGLGNYLISTLQKMDSTLSLLDKEERSEKEIYSWNYGKLEDYLRSKYHYDFINIIDCEEDYDEDHIEIRYFDSENNNKDVKVIFDKKNKEGYVYTTNKKVKKRRIPLITDYLQREIITHYDDMIGYFNAFCSPQAKEFILSISSIDTYNDDVREILSNDKSFMEALKETKDHFDRAYRKIISYPDFMF